jgi:parvulin-like peptidyl-prolyl isomerase
MPYPAVVIGYRDGFSFRTLAENMASIKRFYESQDFSQVGLRVDFSTKEGAERFKVREKEVFNKMIEDEAIMRLARDRGITVSDEMVKAGLQRKLEEYSSSLEVKQNLDKLYGWTIADFESKVVRPSLYSEKLNESFLQETDIASRAASKIEEAQKALQKGTSFADVAQQYSEGQTATDGGNLGWFTLSDLAPELRVPVAAQKIGVPGDVVESTLGFHIVMVEEKKKDAGKDLYRLRQIFTKKETFADWLTAQMKNLPILILSPEYVWNVDEARAEFKSQELRDLEKNIFDKTSGDALFFF